MADSKKRQLIINYTPGEECRVAVVNNGRLDEFHSERRDQVSHVGNIYVGKVTNVEPSIQAAFVDFGLEVGGFLHTTDVHPLYFPDQDDDTTERVGKKTARRDRPPIQDCLKRGQEIIVQVLKEGVGSKGPTLTSYLSIPGRYLVMMPQMDNVGVSRKVEDEETRAKMKDILDSLELPEGFGFILRTAGLDRSKSELKRDLAYLMRLQKDMERRHKAGSKPRLLYSESDLLLRCLRDMLGAETDEVIIDSDAGLQRAARFMTIFAPKSETRLLHYRGKTPIYHALGVEEQIRTMYAREVPLPSGGRLVIDEAEALVAIDVNSGKSRSAGDSEENAYHTNLEAADEICRQLRLRDLGGIVINDLIDMRAGKHRREVEEKFDEILKSDRARSTVLPINDFGVMALTRQRMRGSHESIHFHDCPTCRGRGLIQRPESVAADALRDLAALLDHDKVVKAEMVVNPKVAAELLSARRKQLSRIEAAFGKALTVRLSDATPVDRVTFYAYDQQGNDIEIERLGRFRVTNETLVKWDAPESEEAQLDDEFIVEPEEPAPAVADQAATADEKFLMEEMPTRGDLAAGDNFSLSGAVGRRAKKKRGRGRGRGRDERAGDEGETRPAEKQPSDRAQAQGGGGQQQGGQHPEHRRDGRRDGVGHRGGGLHGVGPALGVDGQPIDAVTHAPMSEAPVPEGAPQGAPSGPPGPGGEEREGGGRRRRRRRGGRGRGRAGENGGSGGGGEGEPVHAPRDPMTPPPLPGALASEGEPQSASEGDGGHQRSPGHVSGGEPGGAEGGEGGGRRRRRRRGGRGRSRGDGEGGGGGGADRGSDRGRSGGESGGQRSSGPSSPPTHVEPKPAPAAAPAPTVSSGAAPAPAVKPLRTLYSVFKKLKPGQLKGIKREE
jgi:ribonuclease E